VLIAITREISPAIARCELSDLARQPIDLDRARAQHAAYEACLREAGCRVVRLAADGHMPDSVFIEDTAVVFDEIGIITRPGAESRRAETRAVADLVRAYRPLRRIEPPGTLDGGDVLAVGTRVFVGESRRTNRAAISQMTTILAPFGYTVTAVPVRRCLHLKSAVTAVSDDTLLVNRDWAPAGDLVPFNLIDVERGEPGAANALRIGDRVIYPTMLPRTRARLEDRGVRVAGVDMSELAKAEGAVTCCSVIFRGGSEP
jgi:dimethylargininase